MFLTKQKRIIVGLAAVAVMSLGGVVPAMAAPTGILLTPTAGYVDFSKIDVIPGGTLTVIEGVTPHIEGGATAKTAPGPSFYFEWIDFRYPGLGDSGCIKSDLER